MLRGTIEAADLPFVVVFVHGSGGIGKSRLLEAMLNSISPEVRRHILDCRHIEPTPHGFLTVLGAALGTLDSAPDLATIVTRLGEPRRRTVLVLDTYETFGLMDTWLRQEFVPALPESVLTIIAGREGPSPAWLTTPGWESLFREVELRELPDDDARKMLESRGLGQSQIERVRRFARGHPLALELAAAAVRAQPSLEIAGGPSPKVLQRLLDAFLTGLPPDTTEAIEAASTVRRVTVPSLMALLGVTQTKEVFDSLQELPFVDATGEGLILHDVVRETIAKELSRRDPERSRTYRRRAWRFFTSESRGAVARSLWQSTADMLYLIENPVVREAFFPEGASQYRLEPATVRDAGEIRAIAAATEPEESARWIERWWERHPEIFNVARGRDGRPTAFYMIFDPAQIDAQLLAADPVTAAWSRHVGEHPVAQGERVLFLRRWLAHGTGEAPSPAQAACWLDIKRTYMEFRPSLRRLYTTVTDLLTYAPIVQPLGFAPVTDANVVVGGRTYHAAVLDFGPSSVDGWLSALVGGELGVESAPAAGAPQPAEGAIVERRRLLVSVLFTDIVGATEQAARLGDRQWGDLLERHHALVRREIGQFQGREIDTAGDGFFATFDTPIRAIQCASAISDSIRPLGIEVRAGLHTGECEVVEKKVAGIAVHIGARVAAMARAGEVLVSSTVKDLVAGSDIRFEERGTHVLKGIPGEWRLFGVKRW